MKWNIHCYVGVGVGVVVGSDVGRGEHHAAALDRPASGSSTERCRTTRSGCGT
jgi:hypothetical protein